MSRDAASLMLDSMVQDLERATGPGTANGSHCPRSVFSRPGSLAQAQFMLSGLIVDQAAMKRNLDPTRGLIVAEAVMMGLAPALGRQQAHDEVYAACREAFTRSEALLDALLRRPTNRIRPAPRSARRPVRAVELSRNGRGDGGPRARASHQTISKTINKNDQQRSTLGEDHLHGVPNS